VLTAQQVISANLEPPIMSFIHAPEVIIVLVKLKIKQLVHQVILMINFLEDKLEIVNFAQLGSNVEVVNLIEGLFVKKILTAQEVHILVNTNVHLAPTAETQLEKLL